MNAYTEGASSAYSKVSGMLPGTGAQNPDATGKAGEESDFMGFVRDAVARTSENVNHAESTALRAMVGDADLHELVTAINQAEMTVKTIVAVRDKVINAYQDIIKMPV